MENQFVPTSCPLEVPENSEQISRPYISSFCVHFDRTGRASDIEAPVFVNYRLENGEEEPFLLGYRVTTDPTARQLRNLSAHSNRRLFNQHVRFNFWDHSNVLFAITFYPRYPNYAPGCHREAPYNHPVYTPAPVQATSGTPLDLIDLYFDI